MPHINVKLTDRLFETLKQMKAEIGAEDWVDFFEKISNREVDIPCDFIEIDGDDPGKHAATIKLGDYIYRWTGTHFDIISTPANPALLRKALITMLTASAV